MNLTSCQMCRQQISPLSTHCPSCGHPTPPAKKTGMQFVSLQLPLAFYGVVFAVSGLVCTASGLAAALAFGRVKNGFEEQLAVTWAILAAISGLICLISGIAGDQKR